MESQENTEIQASKDCNCLFCQKRNPMLSPGSEAGYCECSCHTLLPGMYFCRKPGVLVCRCIKCNKIFSTYDTPKDNSAICCTCQYNEAVPKKELTLDEAIAHAAEKGKESSSCGAEHRQLYNWLTELKERRAIEEKELENEAEADPLDWLDFPFP